MLLTDEQIRLMCQHRGYVLSFGGPILSPPSLLGERSDHPPLIEPFSEQMSGSGVISWGLTAAGYDLRLGPEVLVFKNSYGAVVDPKRFKDPDYQQTVFDRIAAGPDGRIIIPAHGYVLGTSLETLHLPRRVKGRCTGKSTYARCGLIVNTTPLECGWFGKLTVEISNANPCPAVVYAGEGICQVEFELLAAEPGLDYGQRGGKYDGQTGVTPPRVL